MTGGRLRPVSARGVKRDLRSAAMGALVSSNFCISHCDDGSTTVQFGNVYDERAISMIITIRELDRKDVYTRLGEFLTEKDGNQGYIARGTALPWPVVLQVIGEAFRGRVRRHETPPSSRRIQGVAEVLGLAEKCVKSLWHSEGRPRDLGDWMATKFLHDHLIAKATETAMDGAFADLLARRLANRRETYGALLELQEFYAQTHKLTSSKDRGRKFRLAKDLNKALGDNKIEGKVWEAMKAHAAPDLCLKAVFSKVRATHDAAAVLRCMKNLPDKALLQEAGERESSAELCTTTAPEDIEMGEPASMLVRPFAARKMRPSFHPPGGDAKEYAGQAAFVHCSALSLQGGPTEIYPSPTKRCKVHSERVFAPSDKP